jgi:hypothetical protein
MAQNPEKIIQFLNQNLIDESKKLLDNELYNSLLVHIAQGIEVLGAFLDAKPLRARDQSRTRFDAAIHQFFPPAYRRANADSWLYKHYRTHVIHTFLPGSHLLPVSRKAQPDAVHLSNRGAKLVLVYENLQMDYQLAVNQIIKEISAGSVKSKMMEGL